MLVPDIVVIGAGPVGLYLTYLLTILTSVRVTLYEMRGAYTRSRYVKLDSDLNSSDDIRYSTEDDDTITAILSDNEVNNIRQSRAFTKDVSDVIMGNMLGKSVMLSYLESVIYSSLNMSRVTVVRHKFVTEDIYRLHRDSAYIIDCSGYRSVLRDYVSNTEHSKIDFILEKALIVTFQYQGLGTCDERCKYRRNIGMRYKFIPAIDMIHMIDGTKFITGIVSLDDDTHDKISSLKPLTKDNLSTVSDDVNTCINNFMDKMLSESGGQYIDKSGGLLPISLNLYRSKKFSRHDNNTKILLLGDSAIGSPYFQSLTLGLDGCKYLVHLISNNLSLDMYDTYMEKQWLRVYIRSIMIRNNKHLLSAYGSDSILDMLKMF